MIASHDRQRSKSSRKLKIKSPLRISHKISLNEDSLQKITFKKIRGTPSDSTDSDRKPFVKIGDNNQLNHTINKNGNSTYDFKNKITISSGEFNRLRQKLKSTPNTTKWQTMTNKRGQKGVNIKILQGLSRHTSSSSDKTNTNQSSGSSGSEQIQLLKVQNEYFKKIYDETLGEVSKLKYKLKEEKKVHQVEKQIYQNQINKLKRIVDVEKQQVSHIICDEENRYIIVISTIDKPSDSKGLLGIDSDCEDSIGNLSIESK